MKFLTTITKNKWGKKQLLLVTTPLCLSLLLTGCNGKDLTHVNDAFKGKPIKVEKAMADETSHMAGVNTETQNDYPLEDGIILENGVLKEIQGGRIVPNEGMSQNNKILPIPERPKPQNFNNKTLFVGSLKSDTVRLDRLERAVQDMRNDFDSVTPSIRRLMAIEGEMQTLIAELKKVNEGVDSSPLTASSPQNTLNTKPIGRQTPTIVAEAIPTPKTVNTITTKTPPPVQGSPSIYDVRVGEHPGKTRIVMDVNAKTDFNVDIDNNEKIMIVDFPKAGWSANTARNFTASPYISSYKAEPSDEGTLVIFQLKQAAKIAYKDDLKGTSDESRRVVIDVTGN